MASVPGPAAVFRSFRHEHQSLIERIGRLREMFRVGHARAGEHRAPPRLIDALVALRDHLGMMFALEQAIDEAWDADALAPRLDRRHRELRAEHTSLFQELCRMIEFSENAFCHHRLGDLLDRIERRFDAFCRHLRAHESRENELMLQALDDDIGVGD